MTFGRRFTKTRGHSGEVLEDHAGDAPTVVRVGGHKGQFRAVDRGLRRLEQ